MQPAKVQTLGPLWLREISDIPWTLYIVLRFTLILLGVAYRLYWRATWRRLESAFRYREQFRDIKAASLPEILSRLDDSRLAWPLPSTFEVVRETNRLRHRFLRLALAYLGERRRLRCRGHLFCPRKRRSRWEEEATLPCTSSRARRSCFSRDTFNPLGGIENVVVVPHPEESSFWNSTPNR